MLLIFPLIILYNETIAVNTGIGGDAYDAHNADKYTSASSMFPK